MQSFASPPPPRRVVLAGFAALLAASGARRAQAATPLFSVVWHAKPTARQRAIFEAWIAKLQIAAQGWWPIITSALASPGFTPAQSIILDISNITPRTVPAFANNGRIVIDFRYTLNQIDNPDRLGMVAHEMIHVAQAYPPYAPPWLGEGIADYLRYYVLLPDDPGRGFDGRYFGPWIGYQPTAGLLDWIEQQHPGAVRAINADLREGGDGIGPLKRFGGADVTELWRAYLATKPAAATPEAELRRERALAKR